MPILIASRNAGKIREFETLLEGFGEFYGIDALDDGLPEVIEDAETFVGNAFKKAWELCQATGLTTIADDSGLEVDALGGAPGVYSARYAGKGSDEANNAKLVRELADVPPERRTARYVAVVCLVVPPGVEGEDVRRRMFGRPAHPGQTYGKEGELVEIDGHFVVWFRATCEGRIVDEPRGEGGFGYDPHFLVDDWGKTMAEVSLERKNERSHRAAAVRELLAFVEHGTCEITVNGETTWVPPGLNVDGLLTEIDVVLRKGIAVAQNGRVVPRSAWETTAVEPGDEIEIVKATQGG